MKYLFFLLFISQGHAALDDKTVPIYNRLEQMAYELDSPEVK